MSTLSCVVFQPSICTMRMCPEKNRFQPPVFAGGAVGQNISFPPMYNSLLGRMGNMFQPLVRQARLVWLKFRPNGQVAPMPMNPVNPAARSMVAQTGAGMGSMGGQMGAGLGGRGGQMGASMGGIGGQMGVGMGGMGSQMGAGIGGRGGPIGSGMGGIRGQMGAGMGSGMSGGMTGQTGSGMTGGVGTGIGAGIGSGMGGAQNSIRAQQAMNMMRQLTLRNRLANAQMGGGMSNTASTSAGMSNEAQLNIPLLMMLGNQKNGEGGMSKDMATSSSMRQILAAMLANRRMDQMAGQNQMGTAGQNQMGMMGQGSMGMAGQGSLGMPGQGPFGFAGQSQMRGAGQNQMGMLGQSQMGMAGQGQMGLMGQGQMGQMGGQIDPALLMAGLGAGQGMGPFQLNNVPFTQTKLPMQQGNNLDGLMQAMLMKRLLGARGGGGGEGGAGGGEGGAGGGGEGGGGAGGGGEGGGAGGAGGEMEGGGGGGNGAQQSRVIPMGLGLGGLSRRRPRPVVD